MVKRKRISDYFGASKRRRKITKGPSAIRAIAEAYNGSGGEPPLSARERTWGEFGTQLVAGASGAALGFIMEDFPGAMTFGELAYNAAAPDLSVQDTESDYMNELLEAAGILPIKNNRMPKFDQGSFAAPYKVQKAIEDIYCALGSYKVKEQYGAVTGSEAVYAGACGFDVGQFSSTLANAMLRKLFRKLGIDITDPNMYLTRNNLAEAYVIKSVYEANNGNTSTFDYTTIENETLSTLAGNTNILGRIADYIAATFDGILVQVHLGIIDNTSVDGTVFKPVRWVATLNLKNEKVHMHMSSTVKVQNITKGKGEAGAALDVVDAQPLKGFLYYFKKGNPRTKMSYSDSTISIWTPFETTNLGGVILVSSGGAGVDSSMKDPPTPGFFANCSKASYVKLEPGAIKKFKVENNVVKYYYDLIRAATWFGGNNTYRKQNIADTMLVGLEETLNSGSSNIISLVYEAENCTGAYFKTGKLSTMKKEYSQLEVNQFQPS